MSSCCGAEACSITARHGGDTCPACGLKGVNVDTITLKALLTSDGLRRGMPISPRYCGTALCDVVYFDNEAGAVFREADVIVPVHAKQPDNEAIPVCYCFGHTPESIRQEIESTGSSTATAVITSEVTAGHCACEVRNPKGSCCLGDVARVERRLASALAITTSQATS